MKKIKYRIMREVVSGADETKIEHRFDEFFSFATEASLPRTLEIISSIAYNGEYTIEDDGKPEPVIPPTNEELAAGNKLLKQQVSALTDQQSFYEDCIAEMAEVVYA